MKFVYLANGRVGLEILKWLIEGGNRPSGLIIHPLERSRQRDEIRQAANLPQAQILEAPALRTEEGLNWLHAQQPDWLVCVFFGYLLKPEALSIPRYGAVNLHPSLLPHNRGANPNIWSIIERSPAGCTLHFVDAGVDTGDIITQKQVPVLETDTGKSLYARLEEACIDLFKESWPGIRANCVPRTAQASSGTFHRVSDVEQIDRIDPDRMYRAGELIDILRARTFPPHKGAYLDMKDRRIYLRLDLSEEKS